MIIFPAIDIMDGKPVRLILTPQSRWQRMY